MDADLGYKYIEKFRGGIVVHDGNQRFYIKC